MSDRGASYLHLESSPLHNRSITSGPDLLVQHQDNISDNKETEKTPIVAGSLEEIGDFEGPEHLHKSTVFSTNERLRDKLKGIHLSSCGQDKEKGVSLTEEQPAKSSEKVL